ncbi:MAG: adenosylcobinamide-GDP ribazoletransferase [Actinobacteria bacterium]|nr:adenosylcobinamide-GDP ribazoletransferase [Actinomycetota bacterium]MCL5882716.1 adenosylcobinamide-GDP ribazoletransferase [Actinomycetota bacterium]
MKGLRRVFGFFTILPLSQAGTIRETAGAAYLLPLVGAFLGALEGLAGWGSLRIFGQPVAAALVLAAALLLTGLHHADGLADLGDALMVHGDRRRRIEVLKDRTMGIGAAGALVLTYLITWAALSQLLLLPGGDAPGDWSHSGGLSGPGGWSHSGGWLNSGGWTGWHGEGAAIVAALAAVEIAARLSLFTVAAASKASHEGSGKIFLETLRGWRNAVGIILSLAGLMALALVLPFPAVAAAAGAAFIMGIILAAIGRISFGGAGGDILGAAVELGRMAAVLGLIAVLA